MYILLLRKTKQKECEEVGSIDMASRDDTRKKKKLSILMRTGIAAFIISFACCICTFYVQTMVSVCAYIQARDYERIRRGPENFQCFFQGSLDL